ncbi:hypothetical protein COO60DRAFT_416828 [Scenedesmus sp. NREL 46B-D3]|nr:hypothetical protein COO60DRAFT_416828 [Scenedesmus sp. NREL 46B-D3]
MSCSKELPALPVMTYCLDVAVGHTTPPCDFRATAPQAVLSRLALRAGIHERVVMLRPHPVILAEAPCEAARPTHWTGGNDCYTTYVAEQLCRLFATAYVLSSWCIKLRRPVIRTDDPQHACKLLTTTLQFLVKLVIILIFVSPMSLVWLLCGWASGPTLVIGTGKLIANLATTS